jgi:hypothetical protein
VVEPETIVQVLPLLGVMGRTAAIGCRWRRLACSRGRQVSHLIVSSFDCLSLCAWLVGRLFAYLLVWSLLSGGGWLLWLVASVFIR